MWVVWMMLAVVILGGAALVAAFRSMRTVPPSLARTMVHRRRRNPPPTSLLVDYCPRPTRTLTMTAASTSSSSSTAAQGHEQELKVVSFNILAPCYHRLKDTGQMEADSPDIYLARNRLIVQQLLSTEADVICLQEFWCASDELRRLYTDALCGPGGAGYSVRELRRTSHWRVRADGLACFVKDSRLVIQDTRQILFHDCGDRVAQMFLLALRPPPAPPGTGTGPGGRAPAALPAQQFIVVNTHLLFPHNEYSTKIRLRELAKILGFVDSYRVRELCSTICGRSDVRLPVIIAGDFNGSPEGKVYGYALSQNYRSSFVEYALREGSAAAEGAAASLAPTGGAGNSIGAAAAVMGGANEAFDLGIFADPFAPMGATLLPTTTDTDTKPVSPLSAQGDDLTVVLAMAAADDAQTRRDSLRRIAPRSGTSSEATAASPAAAAAAAASAPASRWISHRSHRQENVAVDHIFFCNPSLQVEEKIAPIPDWTNLVYREILERIIERYELTSMQDVFKHFDTDRSNFVTLEEFEAVLTTLGFIGEGQSALLPEEIQVLVETADKDGNGMIDYKEFCDRFRLAANDKELQQQYSYKFGKRAFFARSNFLSDDLGLLEATPAALAPALAGSGEAPRRDGAVRPGAGAGAGVAVAPPLTRSQQAAALQGLAQVQPSSEPSSGLSLATALASAGPMTVALDTRQMGDVAVKHARLTPAALAHGEWPADYVLSDHGMVEVVFAVPPPVAVPVDVIDPQPRAMKSKPAAEE